MERRILREGIFFLLHIFFLEPGGSNACTPLQAISSETTLTPLIGCVSLTVITILTGLSKSDRVVFISHGLLPVTHLLDRPTPTNSHPLFTNHNVTACQSTRGHQERIQNPCQQSLYNTNNMKYPLLMILDNAHALLKSLPK